jgi:hypothetical protein
MAPKRGPQEAATFITKTCKRTAMNEQQPYEKHLAEKLQQLLLPDVERNWQQMRGLLDKEMPRRGGYWRWITGIGILLFMLGGTWFFISHNHIGTNNVTAGRNADSSEQSTAASGSSNVKLADKDSQKQNNVGEVLKGASENSFNQSTSDSIKVKNIEENLHNGTPSAIITASDDLIPPATKSLNGRVVNEQKNNNRPRVETDHPNKGLPAGPTEQSITPEPNLNLAKGYGQKPGEETLVKTSSVQFYPQNAVAGLYVGNLVGDSIGKEYYLAIFPENKVESKGSGKLSGKKSTKSANMAVGENKNLAFGFSLPMGFPVGDQKPGGYNINAKPNTVSDFIPVPHMQYHINNNVYLQTELQLMSPQFIQPILMYQNKTVSPGTNSILNNSVYAKKLYYFNLPVAIHYSPFQHFYLGTGVQFSSFISGVALEEETSSVIGSGTSTLISEQHTKFKDDSISNRIDKSEFRLMLDANYYWKQFTVGLRYNQAFSNYVSFRLNPLTPAVQDKNKSLQFYLRYNFWETHKKR